MRQFFLFMTIVMLITSMVCFVGCTRDDLGIKDILNDRVNPDQWHFADIHFFNVDISISDNKPAEIMVTFTAGSHSNTCIFIDEIHQERNGNIISLWGTIATPKPNSGLICGAAVTEARGQVSLGTLSSFADGEYEVNGKKFRVEDGEIWITKNPDIENIEILISESRPAQVTVNVTGYFWEACMPFLETDHKQEGDTVYIQIISEIPGGVHCPLIRYEDIKFDTPGLTKFQNQVSIGEFAAGKYIVKVNGITNEFVIE